MRYLRIVGLLLMIPLVAGFADCGGDSESHTSTGGGDLITIDCSANIRTDDNNTTTVTTCEDNTDNSTVNNTTTEPAI